MLLERVEVAADRRFRHAQFPDQVVEGRESADPNEVEQTAAAFVIVHV